MQKIRVINEGRQLETKVERTLFDLTQIDSTMRTMLADFTLKAARVLKINCSAIRCCEVGKFYGYCEKVLREIRFEYNQAQNIF